MSCWERAPGRCIVSLALPWTTVGSLMSQQIDGKVCQRESSGWLSGQRSASGADVRCAQPRCPGGGEQARAHRTLRTRRAVTDAAFHGRSLGLTSGSGRVNCCGQLSRKCNTCFPQGRGGDFPLPDGEFRRRCTCRIGFFNQVISG